eukprot:gnl/TRDRNA2_/TRDRNA2_160884_c3_seq1.p1 gnl/TRDRNA2_/TRDRNA2_160884_c3~~gnl/TRDRNA2_/TRDRNA2_160884_c3_seq1.p1  ORF type:complete len:481 (+),score=103.00 gnl/TRDRNA2_/TRDRNA2_160884_c3_seq1:122-1444(+)
MFWVMVLLLIAIYLCAIFCVLTIGRADYPQEKWPLGWDTKDLYFGTIPDAMVTLFNMVLLAEWPEIIRPVWAFQWPLVCFFACFVGFTTLGILNVIVGVIVEQTAEAAKKEHESDILRKHKDQMNHVKELVAIMRQMDDNSDGEISAEEMGSPENEKFITGVMSSLDLPPGFTPVDLHAMLDTGCDGKLSTREFIEGMFRMVFSNDFHRACMSQLAVNQLKGHIVRMEKNMQQEFDGIKDTLKVVMRELQGNSSQLPASKDLDGDNSVGGGARLAPGGDKWSLPTPPAPPARKHWSDEAQASAAAVIPIDLLVNEMRAELQSSMADILSTMKQIQAASAANESGLESFEVALKEMQAKAVRLRFATNQASLTATGGAGSRWRDRVMCCTPSSGGDGWSEEVMSYTQASRTRTITLKESDRSNKNFANAAWQPAQTEIRST